MNLLPNYYFEWRMEDGFPPYFFSLALFGRPKQGYDMRPKGPSVKYLPRLNFRRNRKLIEKTGSFGFEINSVHYKFMVKPQFECETVNAIDVLSD
jgi:hypothetical protein